MPTFPTQLTWNVMTLLVQMEERACVQCGMGSAGAGDGI